MNSNKGFLFGAIAGLCATVLLAVVGSSQGCASLAQGKQVVHDSVILADDACVLLRDSAPDASTTEEICVRADEIKKLAPLFAAARRDAGSDASK